MERFINRYEEVVFKIIGKYKLLINNLQEVHFKIWDKIIGAFTILVKGLADGVNKIGKISRYLTFPLHWIDIKIELRRIEKLKKMEDLPIFRLGAHYIYGKPGSGKSTMTYHAMMDYAYQTGKRSYTTAPMEIPRKKLNGSEYFYHQVFEPSDFYRDGEQYASFDQDFNFVVYEEMLTRINQRNNKKTQYNDVVIPMIGSLGTQRHQGIDIFYFISQLPKNDIQLMLMLSGYHIPKIVKGFNYRLFLKTGKIRFTIKGWKIKSFKVVPKGFSDYELVFDDSFFYPCKYLEDMNYFNRLNMQNYFKDLPKAKPKGMSAHA